MRTGIKSILVLILVSLFLFSVLSGTTQAFPYKIEGYLKDTAGNPIPQANISISGELYNSNNGTFTPVTHYRETDSNGYYNIYIAANEPGGFLPNTQLTISYNPGTYVVSEKVSIVEGLGTWCNLTYDPSGSVLTKIVVTPVTIEMGLSGSVTLTAQGYDQNGGKMSCTPVWKDFSGHGLFTDVLAGNPATATYHSSDIEVTGANITATQGSIVGYAKVTVKKSGIAELFFSPIGIMVIVILISTVLAVMYISIRSGKQQGSNTRDDEVAHPRPEKRRRRQR